MRVMECRRSQDRIRRRRYCPSCGHRLTTWEVHSKPEEQDPELVYRAVGITEAAERLSVRVRQVNRQRSMGGSDGQRMINQAYQDFFKTLNFLSRGLSLATVDAPPDDAA